MPCNVNRCNEFEGRSEERGEGGREGGGGKEEKRNLHLLFSFFERPMIREI